MPVILNGIEYLKEDVRTVDDLSVGDDAVITDALSVGGNITLTGTASTVTLEANTQTSGNVVSIKSTPGSASTACVMCLEADGSSWDTNSCVLKIISDDTSAVNLVINNGASDVLSIYRTGAIDTIGNITLLSGGSILSSANGNVSIIPNGNGIFYCGTGSPGHLTPTTGEAYFQGKVEFDNEVFFDNDITITAKNIITDTTTGMKIGTATNQKLGFFNKTPVVQLAKASYNNWAALGDVVNALVAIGLFDAA